MAKKQSSYEKQRLKNVKAAKKLGVSTDLYQENQRLRKQMEEMQKAQKEQAKALAEQAQKLREQEKKIKKLEKRAAQREKAAMKKELEDKMKEQQELQRQAQIDAQLKEIEDTISAIDWNGGWDDSLWKYDRVRSYAEDHAAINFPEGYGEDDIFR